MSAGEIPSEVKEKKPFINLKVKINKDQSEVGFKLKRTTKLQKLVDTLCKERSLDPNALIFTYDGDRINKDKTPEEHNMDDGDEIDVFLLSDGGSQIVAS